MQALVSSCRIAHKISHVVGIWDGRLDGGNKSGSDIRTEPGRHGELGNVFFFLYRCGNALLAQQLQCGDAMLNSHDVERWARCQEQTRVPVTPAERSDGALCWCIQCVDVFALNIVELDNGVPAGWRTRGVSGKEGPLHPCHC